VALAEMCVAGDLGADLAWEIAGRADLALFGEGGSRIVVEVHRDDVAAFERSARAQGVPLLALGAVSAEKTLAIRLKRADVTLELREPIAALRQRWEEAIPWAMR
jgi:phosphoribosylformylglycinamidine synthase